MNYKRIFEYFFFGLIVFSSTTVIIQEFAVKKVETMIPNFYPRTLTTNQSAPAANYSWCQAEAFRDYKQFRQTIIDVFTVLSEKRLTIDYKANFLKVAVEFLSQLKEEKTFQTIDAVIDLELPQDVSKMLLENIEDIFVVLGIIFRRVKTKFENHFGHCISKCYQDLDSAKKRIYADLYDVQSGAVCKKSKQYLYALRDLQGSGMGSTLHRLSQILAIGLQKGLPLFVDDSKFHYGHKVLKINFKNLLTCPEISNATRIDFFATGSEMKNPKYGRFTLPTVPKKYVSGFHFCHEDISAWYSGVLITFLTEPSSNLREEYKKFENKYLKKFSYGFVGVQIRSTDKVAKTTQLFRHASDFHNVIQNWEIFEGAVTQNIWVASDNSTYYQLLAKMFSSKIVNSLNVTSDVNVNRYNAQGFHDFFFDVYALRRSSFVIGTHSSNILTVSYELRSVDDIFASSKLLSLDSFYANPSIYYEIPYKTNYPNFCFKNGHPMLESKENPDVNKCFKSSEMDLEHVKNINFPITIDLKTPNYGYHHFSYVFIAPNSTKKSIRSCYAPLFALDKVQMLL